MRSNLIYQVREIINHYRAPAKGYRSREAMSSRYRFLTIPHHFNKLLELEKRFDDEGQLLQWLQCVLSFFLVCL